MPCCGRPAPSSPAPARTRPPHYRALGPKRVPRRGARRRPKLDRVARSFDFLLSVSPINSREAMDELPRRRRGRARRRFRYRPLDGRSRRRQARPLRDRPVDPRRPVARTAAVGKAAGDRSSADDAGDAQHAGLPAASLLHYGTVGSGLLADARAILARPQAPRAGGERVGADRSRRTRRAALIAPIAPIDRALRRRGRSSRRRRAA